MNTRPGDDYTVEMDDEANAPEGSFKQVEPTTQDELDELDTEYRETD